MHSSSSPSGLSLPSLLPLSSSTAPAASGAQSLEAALALVSRSQAEIDALHILRCVPPGRRSAAQVHEVHNWLSSAHPRLFSEFSASVSMGRELCARLRYEAYAKRDVLFSQTDRAEDMYCLLRGSVSIWALSPDCFAGVDPALLAATKQKLAREMQEAARALSSSRAEVRSRSSPRRAHHSRGRSQSHIGPSARAHSPMPPVPAATDDTSPEADTAAATVSTVAASSSSPEPPLQRRVSLDQGAAENSPQGSRRGSFSGVADGGGASSGATARSSASSSSSHAVAAESVFATASPSASPASVALLSAAGARGNARNSSTHGRSHTLAAGALLSPAAAPGASRKLGLSHHHHASISIARSVSPAPHHGGAGAGSDLPSLASAISSATAATHHTPSPPSLPHSAATVSAPTSSAAAAPAATASPSTGVNHTLYLKRSKRSEAKDHLLDPPPVPQLLLKLAEALSIPDPWKWRMMLLGHLRPGGMKQIFGEAGLLQPDGERSATIRAEELPTEVLVLCKADFAELLQGSYHKDLKEKFESMIKIDLLRMHVPYIGGGSGANGSGGSSGAGENGAATTTDSKLLTSSSPSNATLPLSPSGSSASLVASQQQQSADAAATASSPSSASAAASVPAAATLDLSHPTIGYLRKVALYFEFRTFGLRTQIVRQHAPANMVYCIVSGECEIVHELPMPLAPGKGSEEERLLQQQEAEEADSAAAIGSTPRRSLANSALHAKLQQQHLATHSYSGRRAKVTYRPPVPPSPSQASPAATSSQAPVDPNASSSLSSRTVLIGLLGAGQCFGELDHLAPANGLHPFGLRTRSLGAPVVLLLISREDWNKRVLAALVDRATLKKLRARDAWRAQRAADLEARGSLAEMLAASAPNRILNAKSQHQQHLQAMQKQQASALSAASSASAPTTARAAASSSSSLSSPRAARPPATVRALNPSGQGGWQSIRDLGEQPLHTAVTVAATEPEPMSEAQQRRRRQQPQVSASSSSSTAHKIAAVVATEELSHYPSLHSARSHALPLASLTANGSSSSSSMLLSMPALHVPVAPSNAFVRTQTLQGPLTDRSRYSGGVSGSGGGGGSSEQFLLASSSSAKLLTPSPSTARLLQAHRTSYAALPSSVAMIGAEHKEQAAVLSSAQTGATANGSGGAMLYSPSLSQLLPLSPPAAPAPLPSSFALGREVAASLSLRALEHERALLRLRAERLARAGDIARLAALKERAATSRYKVGEYTVPSGKIVSRLDQDNLEALAKLGVPLPRKMQQLQTQQNQQQPRRQMQQLASAGMGSYASASVLAGMLRVLHHPEDTEVLPEPFFIVENDAS